MYVLILIMVGRSIAPVPTPFVYQEECKAAGEIFIAEYSYETRYVCLPLKPLKED